MKKQVYRLNITMANRNMIGFGYKEGLFWIVKTIKGIYKLSEADIFAKFEKKLILVNF
jgi:hypothetical protein